MNRHPYISLLVTGIALCLLSACKSDDAPATPESDSEVRFRVTTEGMTRGSIISGMLPDDFRICAWMYDNTIQNAPEELFIGMQTASDTYHGELVSYNTDTDNWQTFKTYYWPKGYFSVNFYGYFPATTNDIVTVTDGTTTHKAFHHDNTGDDLLVATATGNKTLVTATGGAVDLNFRHALCKVAFKAKRVTDDITVSITALTIRHIKRSGTFTFSAMPTGSEPASTVGSWTSTAADPTIDCPYTLAATTVTLDNKDEAYDLTTTTEPMLLLPQQLSAWDRATHTISENDALDAPGTYLEIACSIRLNGTQEYADNGYIYMPFPADWQAGRSYTYTLNFGGGYAADGRQLLTPIALTETITDWEDGDSDTNTIVY